MFPDIANVLHIRDALWRHKALGSASVMVGAGFSRNADRASSTARSMPDWSEMAQALCHTLYPLDDARRNSALREANGTSGFLRLAQEYQIAFGAGSLNDRIRSLVPDMDYRPGDLHKRLLRLPWADLFSTNWDTLLERTCADVFDRSYDIVRTVGDVPFTTRPRIVKLHGSFPAHQPFIFTEEEYRTYPAKFAPLVNLVQQAMMETIFCLVGFSGDDPNFLHWSGWVRDNLGIEAPKIYLVGWLELSNHRRRMLEARNVMPIDLASLPAAHSWPPDLKHRYALEWFIAALEMGKPYPSTSWPGRPRPPSPPPAHLGPVPPSTTKSPRPEPMGPNPGELVTVREAALRETIEAWAHNRRLYPGWLIAPEHVRETLLHFTRNWISEFSLISNWPALDRLGALAEFAWRLERALLPFPAGQEPIAHAALAAIDREKRTVGGELPPATAHWADTMKRADGLAIALLRNARHDGDRSRFDQYLHILSAQDRQDAENSNAIAYEECLWDLGSGDLARLLNRLDGWMPAERETVWCLRKAGLLAEMGEHARACALLESTLAEIRRGRRREIDDLISLSLESWALYLALAYSARSWTKTATLPKDMPEPFERWRALGLVDCDAFNEYQTLRRLLEANQTVPPEITTDRGFDLNHYRKTRHLGDRTSPTVTAAYQMVLLSELTGIPPIAAHMNLFGAGFRAAAKALADNEPWLATQLAIRMGDDKLFDDVLSRARIARLPARLVPALRDSFSRRIVFYLGQLASGGRTQLQEATMTGSALEGLSRIAVRLHPEDLTALFNEAVSYFRSSTFRRLSIPLGEPLSHLIARTLESMPRHQIQALLPQLFALPLPGDGEAVADEYRWPDPVKLLPNWFDPIRGGHRATEWDATIAHLLNAARRFNPADRSASIYRLFYLVRWQILNQDEKKSFAAALWMPTQQDQFGLPEHTSLHPWVIQLLPEELPGQARNALLHFIAEQIRRTDGDANRRLNAIGQTLEHLDAQDVTVGLTPELQAGMVALLEAWAVDRLGHSAEPPRFIDRDDQLERETVRSAATVLRHVTVHDNLIEMIWRKAESLDNGLRGDVHAFALYPVLAQHWPERRPELIERLRRALLSDRESDVRAAAQGLHIWIAAKETVLAQPTTDLDDIVREVGIGIAARRGVLLPHALGLAEWIFREGPEHLWNLIAKDCEYGLAALLQEASYDRSGQAFDVPAIRAACVRLALAMEARAFGSSPGVTGWLALAQDDPLPEVRNAGSGRTGTIVS